MYPHVLLKLSGSFRMLPLLAFSNRVEPFLRAPTIQKQEVNGIVIYKTTTVVAKHYDKISAIRCTTCGFDAKNRKLMKEHKKETDHRGYRIIGDRDMQTHQFIMHNPYEKSLADFTLGGKLTATIDFTPLLPPRYRNCDANALLSEYHKKNGNLFNGITERFSIFKAKITNTKSEVQGSIVPHMLRHLRADDLWLKHRYRAEIVQRLLDWDDEDMLYHYVDIRQSLKEQEILNYYSEYLNGTKIMAVA